MNFRRVGLVLMTVLLALGARPAAAAGVKLAWDSTDEPDVTGYVVHYGPQSQDYQGRVDAGHATVLTVDGLVSGRTYYFTVQAYTADGTASLAAIEIAARAVGPDTLDTPKPAAAAGARLVAPLDGALDVSSGQVFQWTAVADAQAYVFQIGTTPGAADVVSSGETRRLAWTTPTLPAGQRLYARLRTKVADRWSAHTIEFTSVATAVLLYPVATSTDVSTAETFVWSGITDAQAYRLVLGTSPDAHDLLDTGAIQATVTTVTGLLPGQTLYARVATRRAGVWTAETLTVTTARAARLTSLVGDGARLGQGLAWTTILGADAYALRLGTAPGLSDLLDSGETLATTRETPALPAGQPIYATLATHLDGVWTTRESVVTLAGAALVLPVGDANAVLASGQLLAWTTITNAEAHALTIGTTPGASDLLDTGELQGTTLLLPVLPLARTLHVTLWTKTAGVWNATAAVVTVK